MADIAQRIVVEIDGSGAVIGARRVSSALGDMGRSANVANAGVTSVSRGLGDMRRTAIAAFAAMAGVGSARELAILADRVQAINSQLRIATGSQEAFAEASARAYRISAETGSGYEATATLLSRLTAVGAGYGLTQEKIAATTEVTARALQLSGAAASESSAVIRQLSQALGSGVLRGEEFNSVMENGPRLAKALADGLGLPIGKLRSLAEQGLLTTDVVAKALESQRGTLEAESANYKRTMGQAANYVSDEFGRMVDAANQWTGAGQGVAAALDYLGSHMRDVLGGVAVAALAGVTVATTKAGQAAVASAAQTIAAQNQQVASTIRLHQAAVAAAGAEVIAAEQRIASVPAMFRSVAAEQALLAARSNLTTATAALNVAQAETTLASRGLSSVISMLGGPIGVVTGLLAAGATAWMIWGREAEDAGDKAVTAAERGASALDRLRKAKSFGQDDLSPLRENVAAADAALTEAKRKQAEADAALERAQETARTGGRAAQSSAMPFVAKGAVAAAEKNLEQAKAQLKEAEEIVKTLPGRTGSALGQAVIGQSFDKWVDKFRDKIDPLGAALKDLGEQAKSAGIAVDSQQYRDAEALVRKSFEKKGSKSTAGKSLDLDDYGTRSISALQSASSRELDVIRARLDGEKSAVERAYESGIVNLEGYYAARRKIIDTESQSEVSAQERIISQSQAEKTRLAQLKPQGTRGAEQISDQTRELDERIADAQAKIEVLKTQVETSRADLSAEQAKATRARIDTAMADAQAIITAKEQSLESRVITGLETESTARAKLKDSIREQGAALEKDLVPQIEQMMSAASNPKAQAELQAVLDKIREMNAEAKTQTWADGLKQGVDDYATAASDAFETARDAATSAFSSMEDALVEFTTTGKLSVSDMVTSMLADIARLAIRQSITQPLATGVGNVIQQLLGGGSSWDGVNTSWSGAATTSASIMGNSGFGLATGGRVEGPGTETSDSVPAMLSRGEYVVRAASARKLGASVLDQINETGRIPERHAEGGVVGGGNIIKPLANIVGTKPAGGSSGGGAQSMNVRVEMVNQGTPQQVQSVTPKFDAEGMVLKIITADLARNGPVARSMAGAYNLKRTV